MQQGLLGYSRGCAYVSLSKPAPLALSRAEQTGAGAASRPSGRIAPPRAGKGSPRQAGEAGVGNTKLRDVVAASLPPPTPGPSTSGKSWLSTEEGREDRLQPRRVREDPKEDRDRPRGSSIHSTAHAGSEATAGWTKGCSARAPLISRSPVYIRRCQGSFLTVPSPTSQPPPGVFPILFNPGAVFVATFLLHKYFYFL